MLGLAKSFIIFIFIAILIGIGTESWENAALVIGVCAVVRIVWKILT